jgi:hypothetical protein
VPGVTPDPTKALTYNIAKKVLKDINSFEEINNFIKKNNEFFKQILSKETFEKIMSEKFIILANEPTENGSKELQKLYNLYYKFYLNKGKENIFEISNIIKIQEEIPEKNTSKKTEMTQKIKEEEKPQKMKIKKVQTQKYSEFLSKFIEISKSNETPIPVIIKVLPKAETEEKNEEKLFEIFRKHCDRNLLKHIFIFEKQLQNESLEYFEKQILAKNILKILGRVEYEKLKQIKKTEKESVQRKYSNYKKEVFKNYFEMAKNFFKK